MFYNEIHLDLHVGCAMQNVYLGICRQRMPRSACISLYSDQGGLYLLTESLNTCSLECMNAEQRQIILYACT